MWAGDTLYVSGMGGQDPATKAVGESVEAQVTQTVANITTTLKAAGLGVSDVAWAQGYATRLDEAAATPGDAGQGGRLAARPGRGAAPAGPDPGRADVHRDQAIGRPA